MTGPRLYRLLRETAIAAPRSHRYVAAMIIGFSLVALLAILQVRRNQERLAFGYRLSKMSAKVANLQETKRRLEIELAMLSSPARIRTLATKLGMTPAVPDRIRVVTPDKAAMLAGGAP